MQAVGAIALLLSLTVVHSDPWRNGGDPFAIDVPSGHALFELTPTLPSVDRIEALRWMDDCGSARSAQPLTLVGPRIFHPVLLYRRAPRLCARIGPDGHVAAARVLRSSGRRGSDRTLEEKARALLSRRRIAMGGTSPQR